MIKFSENAVKCLWNVTAGTKFSMMPVSFINFSRAFEIISIESPGPKHIKGKRIHPEQRMYLLTLLP